VDGDADAAMEARVRIGWNKFRQKKNGYHSTKTSMNASRKRYTDVNWRLECKG